MIPDRPINLPFFMKDNKKLIPIEIISSEETCNGCFFEHIECLPLKEQTGYCSACSRDDGIQVIFIDEKQIVEV